MNTKPSTSRAGNGDLTPRAGLSVPFPLKDEPTKTLHTRLIILALAAICALQFWSNLSQQASHRTRVAELWAKLIQREHFLYEQHSLLIDEPEEVHIDRNTIVDADGLNVTLFTVVSPQPHRLKIKVDENSYLVESSMEVVGNVSRMTVIIDQLDDKVKTSIHCGRHDAAVLDHIDFHRAMQSYLYPPLTGSAGISSTTRDRPVKLFQWLGSQYLQVEAIFTD